MVGHKLEIMGRLAICTLEKRFLHCDSKKILTVLTVTALMNVLN